jgi:hypothetical protein
VLWVLQEQHCEVLQALLLLLLLLLLGAECVVLLGRLPPV